MNLSSRFMADLKGNTQDVFCKNDAACFRRTTITAVLIFCFLILITRG